MAKYIGSDGEEDLDAEEVLRILNEMSQSDPDLRKNLTISFQLYRVQVRKEMIVQQQEIIRKLKAQMEGKDNGTDGETGSEAVSNSSEPDQAQGSDSNTTE